MTSRWVFFDLPNGRRKVPVVGGSSWVRRKAVYAAIGGALDSRTLMGSGGVERRDEEEEEGGADETLCC